MINGVRSKSAKSKIALFQPLTLLDMVVYYKEHAAIKRIKEVKCLHPFQTLQSEVRKSAIAMFINEVLNKSVKEENHAQELFEFIMESLIQLDEQKNHYENFHLIMLLKLSRLLGFGAWKPQDIYYAHTLTDEREEKLLAALIQAEYGDVIPMDQETRRMVLDMLIRFYTSHIDSFGEVRSIQVLKEVMN
jgi:DNA repair protein RecO (recombination protein O)